MSCVSLFSLLHLSSSTQPHNKPTNSHIGATRHAGTARQPQPQAYDGTFCLERQRNACIYSVSSYAGVTSRNSQLSMTLFSFVLVAKGPPGPLPLEVCCRDRLTCCACGSPLPHQGSINKPGIVTYVLEYLLPDGPGCVVTVILPLLFLGVRDSPLPPSFASGRLGNGHQSHFAPLFRQTP